MYVFFQHLDVCITLLLLSPFSTSVCNQQPTSHLCSNYNMLVDSRFLFMSITYSSCTNVCERQVTVTHSRLLMSVKKHISFSPFRAAVLEINFPFYATFYFHSATFQREILSLCTPLYLFDSFNYQLPRKSCYNIHCAKS